MNLIRTTIGLLLLLTSALATGCDGTSGYGGGDETLTLEVTVADWNGWDPNDRPVPKATTVEVGEGDTFEVDALGGPITFEVTSVDDDEIELEADSALFERNPGGGTNQSDTLDEFTLARDGALELATPTLDAGTDITIAEA